MRRITTLITSILLLVFTSACTTQRTIVDAQLIQRNKDYSKFDQLSIGFNFKFSNGKSIRTRNLEQGRFPLRRFSIESPYGQFTNGDFLLNERFLSDVTRIDSIPIYLESKSNNYQDTFYLHPLKPQEFRVLMNNSNAVNAYSKNTTIYQLKFDDGKWRSIADAYQINDKSKLFKLSIDGYTIEGADSFWLNQTPKAPLESIDVTAQALFDPHLKYRTNFSVDYSHSVSLDFSGRMGQAGRDGDDGTPRFATTQGETGYRGEDGLPVNVFIDHREDQYPGILSVWVVSPYSESHYWFSPETSDLNIISNGGKGGRGGYGGGGLDGDSNQPRGEPGANGGDGGNGGRGGEVHLFFTPEAMQYADFISIQNNGGKEGFRGGGGSGGTNWTEEKKSFLVAILNLDSGGKGLKGDKGNPGPNGPAPKKRILSSEEMYERLQALGIQ